MLTGCSISKYWSAHQTGPASPEKPPERNAFQEAELAADFQSSTPFNCADSLLKADKDTKAYLERIYFSHETKSSHATEGLHSVGAGIGAGNGIGGFVNSDTHITSELSTIYSNIQKVLDLRHKFMRLSLQGPGDNPKDDPGWNIYPPHPEPVWEEEGGRAGTTSNGGNSIADSIVLPQEANDTNKNRQPNSAGAPQTLKMPRLKRKPGQDIGSDFDINELLPLPQADEMTFCLDDSSVFQVYESESSSTNEVGPPIIHIPTIREFYMDLEEVLNISSDGPSKSFAFRRLQYLEGKFNLYVLLNEYQETADCKTVPHRDFYNVRKVDTHVHHSACMNQKHLLRFIKSKIKKFPDEVVMFRDGKYLTLQEVFQSIKLTAYDLSIDTLDMHVGLDPFCFSLDLN